MQKESKGQSEVRKKNWGRELGGPYVGLIMQAPYLMGFKSQYFLPPDPAPFCAQNLFQELIEALFFRILLFARFGAVNLQTV